MTSCDSVYVVWFLFLKTGCDTHRLHGPSQPHANTGQHPLLQQRPETAQGHQPGQGVLPLRTQRGV